MEKEIEKVRDALEDFGKRVVSAVKKGKGEADKVTKIAQLRIEVGSLNRQIGDLYRELGELFYRNYSKKSKKGQEQVAETVTHIAAVEKKIAMLKRYIKAVREDKPLPGAGRPAKTAPVKETKPGRRGRPAKKAAQVKEKKPGRRGRPPKKAAEVKKSKPGRRGRPAKPASSGSTPAAPKRRGRPPKAKTE